MRATPLYVSPTGTSTACTSVSDACGNLQAALSVAVTGDEIVLLPGTHNGAGNRGLSFSGPRSLTITGSGQGVTIIDLQSMGTSPFCCARVNQYVAPF